MPILVSVIIPAYNSAKTIAEALDSVAAQTLLRKDEGGRMKDEGESVERRTSNVECGGTGEGCDHLKADSGGFEHEGRARLRPDATAWREGRKVLGSGCQVEIIVVDDASTDETLEVVGAWSVGRGASHAPTLITLPRNSGPAAARNMGIAAAQGEWIAFLDADDAWLPEKLEMQLKCAGERPDVQLWCGGVVGCGTWNVERGSVQRRSVKDGEEQTAGDKVSGIHCEEASSVRCSDDSTLCVSRLSLPDFAMGNPVATSTVLVRKSAIKEVGGFDERFRGPEDYDLWMRIAAKYEVAKTGAPLSMYREEAGSLSMDDRKFLPQVLGVLDKAFGPGGVLESQADDRIASESNQYWNASWMAFNRGARARAIGLWAKAYTLNRRSAKKTDRQWFRLLWRYVAGSQGSRGINRKDAEIAEA